MKIDKEDEKDSTYTIFTIKVGANSQNSVYIKFLTLFGIKTFILSREERIKLMSDLSKY